MQRMRREKKGIKKAVALKYEEGQDNAPEVIASGRGTVAEKIIERAKELGIPLISNASLADELIKIPPGEEIPPELYRAVAEIYAFLIKIDGRIRNEKRES